MVQIEHNAETQYILRMKPDVVCLSFTSADFTRAKTLASILKHNKIPVLMGGAHITSSPETLPTSVVAGLRGEGENVIVSLIEHCASDDQPGIQSISGSVYHHENGIGMTEPKLIQDVDLIPYPARQMVPASFWKTGVTSLLTSRGCKYRCSFCQVSTTWKYPRLHSAEYVCGEIETVHKQFGIHTFGIVDDLFISDTQRIEDIVRLLEKRNMLGKVGFAVNGRANLMTADLCDLLKRMGVREIAMGLESMSPRILSILKDRATVEDNKRAVDVIHKAGLKTGGLFMIGTPTETEEDMARTYQYVYDNREKFGGLQICITTPLPNTKLWDLCVASGRIGLVPTDADWNRMNIAAENPNTNTYVGDIPITRFGEILTKFRTLFFGDKSKAPQTLCGGAQTILEIPWTGVKISGILPDGWTGKEICIEDIKQTIKHKARIVVYLRELRPFQPQMQIRINGAHAHFEYAPGEITIPIEAQTKLDSIHIYTDTFIPRECGINRDDRSLGINIQHILLIEDDNKPIGPHI